MSENHEEERLLLIEQQELGILKEKQVVQAEAQSRLRESGYHELALVSCDFHKGVLTLTGRDLAFT